MKNIPTILASLSLASIAAAGPAMVSGGKGKTVVPETPAACPNMLSYSYLEGGYIRLDFDESRLKTQNGGYLDGSYEFLPHFLVDGSVTLMDDSDQYTIGLGTYVPLCAAFHLTARGGYSYYEEDGASGQNEWYLSPGFRAMLGCNVELWGKAYFSFDEDNETTISYGGGLTFHVNQHVGLTVGAAASEDAWSFQAGIRYQF
jgi:hypothetical protein